MEEFKVPSVTAKSSNTSKPNKEEEDTCTSTTEEKSPKVNVNKSSLPHRHFEIPYKEPKWSKKPDQNYEYKFEVLKSGAIVEEIGNLQSKAFWFFGRLSEHNDIVMAHPTISRFHAVLQYKPKQDEDSDKDETKFGEGWYIYDLESTHGTFLNKIKIPPKTYIRVKVGHMIKLGGSTRNYILQGPEFDEEPESELSVTELKELRIKQEEEKLKEIEMQEAMREKDGIDWGMGEDADEETDLTVNPYATTNNEELFLDDPKKTLRGFFEREGLELEYKCDEMSAGTFICRVELPIDDMHGRPIIAEVCHKGKKKECVVQCALEACRILDRYGVLRQSHHEPLKRKKQNTDSDEEDDFLDRTGDVERKRQRKLASSQNNALTYDDLIKQENELLEKIAAVEENILRYQEMMKRSKESNENEDNEDLDNFMKNLKEDSTVDKTEIRKLRVEQQRLKSEHQKIQKLIKIAKPINLPSLNPQSTSTNSETKKKFTFPLFGKRNKLKMNITKPEPKNKTIEKEMKSDEEEIEDDDDDNDDDKKEIPQNNSQSISESSVSSSSEQKCVVSEEKEIESSSKTEKSNKDDKTNEKHISNIKQQDIPKRRIGPAFIPEEILKNIQEQQSHSKEQNEKNKKESTENDVVEMENSNNQPDHTEEEEEEEEEIQKEKKRKRIRNRNRGRENIDIDDSAELEDKSKYSGWLPPDNQTGDGITTLNQKFGY